MDTWINGYTNPLLDPSQDLSNITGNTAEGLTTLSFMRKRSTGDPKVIFTFNTNHRIFITIVQVYGNLTRLILYVVYYVGWRLLTNK